MTKMIATCFCMEHETEHGCTPYSITEYVSECREIARKHGVKVLFDFDRTDTGCYGMPYAVFAGLESKINALIEAEDLESNYDTFTFA